MPTFSQKLPRAVRLAQTLTASRRDLIGRQETPRRPWRLHPPSTLTARHLHSAESLIRASSVSCWMPFFIADPRRM